MLYSKNEIIESNRDLRIGWRCKIRISGENGCICDPDIILMSVAVAVTFFNQSFVVTCGDDTVQIDLCLPNLL